MTQINNETKRMSNIGWNFDLSYARLPELLFTIIKPNPVRSPKLAVLNESLASTLGLNAKLLSGSDGISVLAGNEVPVGGLPLAQAYAGHQFGHFTMLGDGRALLLGEQITPAGERFDIQLKGSGRTPYSRQGDGRAALGPMLREYIISEAMHALGIPTTRSLAVVTTGETILREGELPGAILTRVASSHLRVGTFEYVARWGTVKELRTLADYTLQRHFPEVDEEAIDAPSGNQYLRLLWEVMKRQAILIAQWQLVGFIHGVMNTDNMSLCGETIDYGPCAFMDTYDPATVFSSIDVNGRYAYGNQPRIAAWNLARFAEALLPLIADDAEVAVEAAQAEIEKFPELYRVYWLSGMRAKLGLFNEEAEDLALVEDLLTWMYKERMDFTNTFRALTLNELAAPAFSSNTEFVAWQECWHTRLARQQQSDEEVRQLMRNHNPAVIPRNHRVEEALNAVESKGDYSAFERLLATLVRPYGYDAVQDDFFTKPMDRDRTYQTFCGT